MSKIFLGEDAVFYKPGTMLLTQPNFYVLQTYSAGVTTLELAQEPASDTLLQKGTTFYLNQRKHTTSNQETITGGLATVEFSPATAMALPYREVASGNVNLATDTFTYTAHGFMHGQPVQVVSFGTVTGLATGTVYKIKKISNDEFQLMNNNEVVITIGGTADDVTIAANLRMSNEWQTISLPNYCRDPKPEFFIEQSHSFEKSQSEIITLGEPGYWFKWKFHFNLTTEAELSQFEAFVNYANNPKNSLILQPNSAKSYVYRVTMTSIDVEDFYNHSSFDVEFSANFLEKSFPHYSNNNYITRNRKFRG